MDNKLKEANLMLTKVELNQYQANQKKFAVIINNSQKENDVYKHIYFKDRFYVSDETYKQLINTLQLDNIFSLHHVISYRHKMNLIYKMMIIELDKDCLMFNFKIIMQIRIETFLKKYSKKHDDSRTIQIKLSSDGTQVGHKQNFINFTCTFPFEGDIAKSVTGNYTLGVCKFNESYDNYAKSFEYLNEEISHMKKYIYNNTEFRIVYSFVGDLPVLRSALGLTGFNSTYPCFCCKVKKSELHIINYDFSIFNDKYKRSYEEQDKIINDPKLLKTPQTNFGYKNKPLLTSIDYSQFCYDTLHLELNISRYLISLFEKELMSLDKINKNSSVDFKKHPNLAKYFGFLNNKCNLNLEPILSNKNGDIKLYRSLRCREYHKIFKKINIIKYFSEIKNATKIQKLWNDFQLIMSNIKRNQSNRMKMKTQIKNWYIMFSKLFNAIDSHSVYFHLLVHHTHQFMKVHSNIHNLNIQGNYTSY